MIKGICVGIRSVGANSQTVEGLTSQDLTRLVKRLTVNEMGGEEVRKPCNRCNCMIKAGMDSGSVYVEKLVLLGGSVCFPVKYRLNGTLRFRVLWWN